jgi:hypothetical protein
MAEYQLRDRITVEDEQGNAKEFAVEALFNMNDEAYALLKSDEDMVLMQVVNSGEDNQFLIGIDDRNKADSILDAYQIAIEAAPAEKQT